MWTNNAAADKRNQPSLWIGFYLRQNDHKYVINQPKEGRSKGGVLCWEDTSRMTSDGKVIKRNLHSLLSMATHMKAMKAAAANREKKTPMKKKSLRPFSQVLQRSCRYMTWVMRVQSANTPEGEKVQKVTLWRMLVGFFTHSSLTSFVWMTLQKVSFFLTSENKKKHVTEMYFIGGSEQ